MRSAAVLSLIVAISTATGCSSLPKVQNGPEPEMRRGSSRASRLSIPPGHLPSPGRCRVWMPGQPPGHQAHPTTCAGIEHRAPAGSWILYRPADDKRVVHVRVVDSRRPGIIVRSRVYDVQRGTLIASS